MKATSVLGLIIVLLSVLVCSFACTEQAITEVYNGDAIEIYETELSLPFLGFGTSSCWWSQWIEKESLREQIAQALYSEQGLNLSVYRYNVGAGERENPNCTVSNYSRTTESFYYWNEQNNRYEYDFSRDSNARAMLDAAIEAGAEEVVLFCNSPHYSFTASGTAAGGKDGIANLPSENYEAFADYLLTIADWFVNQGYPVKYVSPINEPQWDWSFGSHQEGCHYSARQAVDLLEIFAQKMKQKNCSYKLLGIESGSLDIKYNSYVTNMLNNRILNEAMDVYCGHSYWLDNKVESKQSYGQYLANNYPDKALIMSEWCELPLTIDVMSIDSGLYMANIIEQDINLLGARGWENWTAVNEDGLLEITNGNLIYMNRYYAYKNFASFINVGDRQSFVDMNVEYKDKLRTLAFKTNDGLTVVLINNGYESYSPKIITANKYKQVEKYLTDSTHNCQKVDTEQDGFFTLPQRSIVTLSFKN